MPNDYYAQLAAEAATDPVIYELQAGSPMHGKALEYVAARDAFCAAAQDIVRKYDAACARVNLNGLYFEKGKVPRKWELDEIWFSHRPKPGTPADKELSSVRIPLADRYIGRDGGLWNTPDLYKALPSTPLRLGRLGNTFFVAAHHAPVKNVQLDLGIRRSHFDDALVIGADELETLKAAANADERAAFELDINTKAYTSGLSLHPAFKITAEMQAVIDDRKSRHEKWQANPVKKAGDAIVAAALFPVVAIAAMSGVFDDWARGGTGRGGPR